MEHLLLYHKLDELFLGSLLQGYKNGASAPSIVAFHKSCNNANAFQLRLALLFSWDGLN